MEQEERGRCASCGNHESTRDFWGIGSFIRATEVSQEQPVIGWRSWVPHRQGEEFSLGSWSAEGRILWPTDSPARAGCQPVSDVANDPSANPFPTHGCGIEARDNRQDMVPDSWVKLLLSQPAFPIRKGVWGAVDLMGQVAVHEHGFRAQFAKPASLAIVCSFCSMPQGEAEWLIHPEPETAEIFVAACDEHRDWFLGLGGDLCAMIPAAPARESLLARYGVAAEPMSHESNGVSSRSRNGAFDE